MRNTRNMYIKTTHIAVIIKVFKHLPGMLCKYFQILLIVQRNLIICTINVLKVSTNGS